MELEHLARLLTRSWESNEKLGVRVCNRCQAIFSLSWCYSLGARASCLGQASPTFWDLLFSSPAAALTVSLTWTWNSDLCPHTTQCFPDLPFSAVDTLLSTVSKSTTVGTHLDCTLDKAPARPSAFCFHIWKIKLAPFLKIPSPAHSTGPKTQ